MEKGALWAAVDALVDRAPGPRDLQIHGLHLIAARRLRARGLPVPHEMALAQRRAALATLAAPVLLRHARAAYDGPLMVMKGPEIALRYPDPALRAFKDVDLLVDDAEAAQRALLAAGFEEFGPPDGYDRKQHLHPLAWPGLPITIEVHRAPLWVDGLPAPPLAELLEAGRRSGVGVDGVLAPDPAHHVLLLAAHAWAHEPLRRLVELVDVGAVSLEVDAEAPRALAQRWGCSRLWRTTEAAVAAVLRGASPPIALWTWARHLQRARERTVLESRLQRVAGPAWALPARRVPPAVVAAIATHARRHDGEPWRTKLVRTGRLVRGVALPRSEVDGHQPEGTAA